MFGERLFSLAYVRIGYVFQMNSGSRILGGSKEVGSYWIPEVLWSEHIVVFKQNNNNNSNNNSSPETICFLWLYISYT